MDVSEEEEEEEEDCDDGDAEMEDDAEEPGEGDAAADKVPVRWTQVRLRMTCECVIFTPVFMRLLGQWGWGGGQPAAVLGDVGSR